MSEVKQCPFCGDGERPHIQTQGNRARMYINCPKCGAKGPFISMHDHEDHAIAAWNRRAPVSTPQQSAQRASVDTLSAIADSIECDGLVRTAAKLREEIAHINAWGSAGSGDGTAPELYTCKGKGGSYKLIGYAWPAGVLSSTLMVSSYPVYCDTKSGKLFVRTVGDFEQRMERIAAAPSPAPQGEQA